MSNLLEKLKMTIGVERNPTAVNTELDLQFSEVLDDQLDLIAAAYNSLHHSHHNSSLPPLE